ncbi:hypothetical protein H8S10_05210 [Clostridium sp. NSJ-49]|uniref:Uncharacterized protein n=1 Tax=Clostridium disporicum TaxID=84024 RepID=A0A174DHP8_9CLOT|nr:MULTISPECIES: hypothetical protein [Clostridium]MBC5624853.1 hypothetical protein [Clostridium sp. NSJ-49]MCD2500580.1 hypothetical protein [Clostridium sp. NSJ-145]MDU6340053.1 hypothetical protein [Clostridium sp.]CUO23516.1 Uncharacterised protein [Clostridium disporicum]
MDAYQLIGLLQRKMQDPRFASKFNQLADELNSIPGLQQKVMQIVQIDNEKKRQKELDKLPARAKAIVKELLEMLR